MDNRTRAERRVEDDISSRTMKTQVNKAHAEGDLVVVVCLNVKQPSGDVELDEGGERVDG
jgi:hypothetical protein